MNLEVELKALRRRREELARLADVSLTRRYDTRPPIELLTFYMRLRRRSGDLLRWLGLLPPIVVKPWLPGVGRGGDEAPMRPLLIWALGVERDTLRKACRGFQTFHEANLQEFAPVLLTDVADFAFFSRLGWLVEYVPEFAAPAEGYREQKLRYLAWRYRDAPLLSATVGLEAEKYADELCRWVLQTSERQQ